MRSYFAIWVFSIATLACLVQSTKLHSEVVELNDKFLDVMNSGFWLVKFYAPYCVHCKRLAPVWEHVGHALADKSSKVRVGKVDCTRFPSVASKLRVSAYPTIIFFRNGVQIPYEGERKKESLVEFAEKSSGPVVGNIESSNQLHEVCFDFQTQITLNFYFQLRKTVDKGPFLIYINGQNQDLFTEYDEVSSKLFTETRFFRITQPSILPNTLSLPNLPDVVIFKDGAYQSFQATRGSKYCIAFKSIVV